MSSKNPIGFSFRAKERSENPEAHEVNLARVTTNDD